MNMYQVLIPGPGMVVTAASIIIFITLALIFKESMSLRIPRVFLAQAFLRHKLTAPR